MNKLERITSDWYNKVGEDCLRYYKKSHSNELSVLKKLQFLLPNKSTILDVGCGTGKPISQFLSEEGYDVFGVDISKKMISLAKKNSPKAKFQVRDLNKLKFKEKFNAIVCLFVILHLPKRRLSQVFKLFVNALKKEGYLLFSFNEGKKEGYFTFFGRKIYLSQYTKREIEEIIKKSNFKIVWKKSFLFKNRDYKEKHWYYLVQRKKLGGS